MKWSGQHIYDLVAAFRQDVTMDSTLTVTGNTTLSGNLTFDSVGLTAVQTSGESFVDNDTSIMTSAAIDDRINTAVTAEDLDLTSDSGTIDIDLNSETLTVAGGAGIDTSATGTTVTITGETASDSNAGIVELATTAETTTGTDTARAVTPDGLKDGYEGSANVTTLGTITTGVWNGTAINQTYLTGQSGTNTGDETLSSINGLGVTTVGTIDTGVSVSYTHLTLPTNREV